MSGTLNLLHWNSGARSMPSIQQLVCCRSTIAQQTLSAARTQACTSTSSVSARTGSLEFATIRPRTRGLWLREIAPRWVQWRSYHSF